MINQATYEVLLVEAEQNALRAETVKDLPGKFYFLNNAVVAYRLAREFAVNNPAALAHIDDKVDSLIERKVEIAYRGLNGKYNSLLAYVGKRIIGFKHNDFILAVDLSEGLNGILETCKFNDYIDLDVSAALKKGGATADKISRLVDILDNVRLIPMESEDSE
jgi:hypothetical protein